MQQIYQLSLNKHEAAAAAAVVLVLVLMPRCDTRWSMIIEGPWFSATKQRSRRFTMVVFANQSQI